jgi:hypothetical protein
LGRCFSWLAAGTSLSFATELPEREAGQTTTGGADAQARESLLDGRGTCERLGGMQPHLVMNRRETHHSDELQIGVRIGY